MQLGLISPASQAALLLGLCLLECLPSLAPASPEKGGFLACVPRLGSRLFSSCTKPPPTVIHKGKREIQEGAENDDGKRRENHQTWWKERERVRENVEGWRRFLLPFFFILELLLTEPLRRHFV